MEKIKDFGPLNDNSQERFHQGWWRTYVLNMEPGLNPGNKKETICNTMNNAEDENFITKSVYEVVKKILVGHNDSGIIDKTRLFNNLLSSQPLCFNFFGLLLVPGGNVLKDFLSIVLNCNVDSAQLFFEYDGNNKGMQDKSAFDVAFEYISNGKKCLLGLECKYTDPFSHRPNSSSVNYGDVENKNYDAYRRIYDQNIDRFKEDYLVYAKENNLNQLFRNELMAATLENEGIYDIVFSGLFYSDRDKKSEKISTEFSSIITKPFISLTYMDYFEILQKMPIDRELRENTMLLWARYCGFEMSKKLHDAN